MKTRPLTTLDVAAALGIDPSRVRRMAVKRHLGQHHGREWLFTRADVEAMRVRTPGRPARQS